MTSPQTAGAFAAIDAPSAKLGPLRAQTIAEIRMTMTRGESR
jgi:hypothetical protein